MGSPRHGQGNQRWPRPFSEVRCADGVRLGEHATNVQ